MNLHSFRLRSALLSASLAGAALIGFGLVSWWAIQRAKIEQLDAKLQNQVMQTAGKYWGRLHRPEPPGFRTNRSESRPTPDPAEAEAHWQLIEATLPATLGIDADVPVAILVTDRENQVLYQSTTWQSDFDPESLWRMFQVPKLSDFAARNPLAPNPGGFPGDAAPLRRPDGPPELPQPYIATRPTASGNWRIAGIVLPEVQVAIAVKLQIIDQEMATIRTLYLITIPTVLGLISVSAWVLSGSILRPIHQLTRTMQQLTVQGLDQRVPTAHTDVELIQLIQVFNQMLERLERSFHQALRFSGDAAHELKTPLAILQGELEHTIQHLEDGSAIQQTLSNLLDEVRRLSGIVRKLLLLSLADAGQMRLHYVDLDLSESLRELVDDIAMLAPELRVKTDIASQLRVRGDRDLLTQVLQNLISNAIKYNLPSGWIHILARPQRGMVQITISNASQDIPVGDRDRIFDRFHRGDPARTRKVEGVGLGLSLSQEITRTHGGTLCLNSTPAGQTAFTLMLPTHVEPNGHSAIN